MEILKQIENDIISDKLHPVYITALNFLNSIPIGDVNFLKSIFVENSKQDNEISKVCLFAFEKFLNQESLTDTHILGLAWIINAIMVERQNAELKKQVNDLNKENINKLTKAD